MKYTHTNRNPQAQKGIVLFIALIALVAMSLAAVALVRSVDTGTLIAGNLAFKQAGTASADTGTETAVPWMVAKQAAQLVLNKDPWLDPTHAFNIDDPASGYYSSIATPADLTADATWAAGVSRPGTSASGNFDANGTDSDTGNTVRYIIQRVCRAPNQVLSSANCLFSDASEDNGSKRGRLTYDAGLGSGATTGSPVYRITARVTGPKNTVSYVQAYAY